MTETWTTTAIILILVLQLFRTTIQTCAKSKASQNRVSAEWYDFKRKSALDSHGWPIRLRRKPSAYRHRAQTYG